MVKNLVTGGLGCSGAYLARRLLEDGEEVVILTKSGDTRFIPDIRDSVKIVQGDLGNWYDVLGVVGENNIQCIYHLGAMQTDACEVDPQKGYMVNADGFFYLLEAARLFKVDSVIYASAMAGSPVILGDEVEPPPNLYGITKCISEWLGLYYHRRYGVNFRAVTMGGITGPGRYAGINRWLRAMIQESALGRPYRCYVEEDWPARILSVKEAAWALVELKRADDKRLTRRIYDLEQIKITAGEEAAAIKRFLPKAQIEFVPDNPFKKYYKRKENAIVRKPNPDVSRRDWGHHLRYNLDEIIRDFVSDVEANRAAYESIPPNQAHWR
jgi:threonine 3-dehydrogenase